MKSLRVGTGAPRLFFSAGDRHWCWYADTLGENRATRAAARHRLRGCRLPAGDVRFQSLDGCALRTLACRENQQQFSGAALQRTSHITNRMTLSCAFVPYGCEMIISDSSVPCRHMHVMCTRMPQVQVQAAKPYRKALFSQLTGWPVSSFATRFEVMTSCK